MADLSTQGEAALPGGGRPIPWSRNFATAEASRPVLRIGLVNNMPDAALAATERQFANLLAAGAGDALDVELRCFFLPQIPRREAARARFRQRYADIETLPAAGLDALIVTGTEPRARDLEGEAFWPGLAGVIDWARTGTISTIWSCLGAHAAVLRLDGIRRRPLATKLSGVFAFDRDPRAALLKGAPRHIRVPHSRLNTLLADDLIAHGYRILTQSAEAGVDAFARDDKSLFVFLQGHPEYDAVSLAREYRRDVGRGLRGGPAPSHPPRNYFSLATERRLVALAASERACTGAEAAILSARPRNTWRPAARLVFGNWLGEVSRRKALRTERAVTALR